jgi:uncharacterized zinc-type alcohol dehydrogenase-like protein
MKIKAYAASEQKSALTPFEYEPKRLARKEVEVQITHCGICHSDVHLIDDDWGVSTFPLVPGHEIVGEITAIGADVRHLELGARVGIGWQRSSCMQCESCLRGDENLCRDREATCVGHHGGFANTIQIDGDFVFTLPKNLSSENAAPLLCAGVTVYAPLHYYGVKPAMKVGVIGIGGLGHLAIQFAAKFGCEVTAFSTSRDKEAETRKFGAHHFVSSTDPQELASLSNSLDFILSTINQDLNWDSYVNILKPNGKLCFVGVPKSPVNVPVFNLIGSQKSICGSSIGSRTVMREMLEFAARHQIEAKTEVVPMSEVNSAITKVRNNMARYRMVLKA